MRAERPEGRRRRGRTHYTPARGSMGAAAIAIVALLAMTVCNGCIWLAIPSLAYQGYKAEQPANQSGQAKPHDSSQQPQQSSGDQYE
jgi:uncharacterized membrane protein YebE (DUF533 family)